MNHPLPRHPVTGLAAIGWRKARDGEPEGRPIWPVLGAAENDDDPDPADDPDGDPDPADDPDPDPAGADQLGDAGKKALDAMKERARSERDRRKAVELELAALKTKPAEGEPDAAAIRAEALTAARAETLRDRALDRLEAKAARLFADPEDARAHLVGAVEDFIDGVKVDDAAIAEALTDLLTRKPYLALSAASAKPKFEGTGDGGARKGPAGVKQLGKSDLKTMSADQIVEAQEKGQLRDYLAAE